MVNSLEKPSKMALTGMSFNHHHNISKISVAVGKLPELVIWAALCELEKSFKLIAVPLQGNRHIPNSKGVNPDLRHLTNLSRESTTQIFQKKNHVSRFSQAPSSAPFQLPCTFRPQKT